MKSRQREEARRLIEQEERRRRSARCDLAISETLGPDLESARSGRIHKLRRDRLVAAQSLGITREGLYK